MTAKMITNGRGIFKHWSSSKRIPSGWSIVEQDMTVFEDPHVIEKNRKRDIVAKLNQLGIPHDGRSSAEALEIVYEDYVGLQEEEE